MGEGEWRGILCDWILAPWCIFLDINFGLLSNEIKMHNPKYKTKQIYKCYITYREQASQCRLVFAWSAFFTSCLFRYWFILKCMHRSILLNVCSTCQTTTEINPEEFCLAETTVAEINATTYWLSISTSNCIYDE